MALALIKSESQNTAWGNEVSVESLLNVIFVSALIVPPLLIIMALLWASIASENIRRLSADIAAEAMAGMLERVDQLQPGKRNTGSAEHEEAAAIRQFLRYAPSILLGRECAEDARATLNRRR